MLPLTFNNLTIDKSSGNVLLTQDSHTELNGSFNALSGGLIVKPVAQLTVNGPIVLESQQGLILKSDATGTASLINYGNISGGGTAAVENYLKHEATDFGRYISLPISDGHTDFFNSPSSGIWYYNSASSPAAWVQINNSYLDIITGYVTKYLSATTLTYIGDLNTGDLNRTDLIRTTTPDNFGWNLIGNPYPSAIDWDLVDRDNLVGSIYFRKANGTIASYADGVGNPLGTTSIIPPMQSFWTKVTIGNNYGSIYFSNNDRLHSQLPLYKSNNTYPMIRLRASDSINTDETVILFNDDASSVLDNEYDAVKILSQNTLNPQIFSLSSDSNDLSINALKFNNTPLIVPLGFTSPSNGLCTIDAFAITDMDTNVTIYLEDKKLNIMSDLRLHNVYNFTFNDTDNPNRFYLHFNYQGLTSVNPISTLQRGNTDIYSYNNALFIAFSENSNEVYNIHVYNMLGQLLYNESVSDNGQLHKIDLNTAYGHYIVHVFNQKHSRKEKVTMIK